MHYAVYFIRNMLIEPISLVRLYVLGLLEKGDRHGYEIVATAERWAIHRWAGISIGSIYHTLRSLTKAGYASILKVEREGNRPERQVFSITDRGREECHRLIALGLGSLEYEGREVDMSLAFSHRISPALRRQMLENRLGPLEERLAQLRALHHAYTTCFESPSLEHLRKLREESPWIHAGIRHGLARLEVERDWTMSLLSEIDSWPYQPASAEKNTS